MADTCKGARGAASCRRKQAGNNNGGRKEGGFGIGRQNPSFFTWRGILQRDFFLLLLFPAMSTYQSLIVTKQRRTCEMMMMTMVSFFWGMASSDGVFSFSRAASMQQEGDAGIWFSA